MYNLSGSGIYVGAPPTLTPPLRTLHQLPPLPEISGRDGERAELAALLTGGSVATPSSGGRIFLYGMGGVGKSALAVDLANRLIDCWPAAQLYIQLRGADPDGRAPMAADEAMGQVIRSFHPEAPLPTASDALVKTYRSVLSEAGAILLFLDDAADAAQVTQLLPPTNCALIVTSRNRLTLNKVVAREILCLTPANSRILLLEHTKAVPSFAQFADEAANLCDHLPLALRAFAAAVFQHRNVTPGKLVERLRTGRLQLDGVDATFGVSYDLLNDTMRRRWAILSVFTATFTVEAGAAVWGEEIDAAEASLTTLLNGSLVEWNETANRYRLHDLVRQFCAEKLPPAEAPDARIRHAKHYAAVGERADELFLEGGDSVRKGLDLFDAERAHLDAAFAWLSPCTDHATAGVLLALVNAVVYTGDLRFHPHERIRWLEAQRKGASLTGNRQAEGNALGNLGNAYADLGEPRKAIDLYEQRLVIAREIGDRRGEGSALGNLGNAYAVLGEPRKAIDLYEQRLVIAREIGDRRGEGADLGNLGNAYAALGEPRKAIDFHEQRLVIAREIGDRRGEGSALGNLGNAYADLGEPRKAIDFHEQALVIAREIGDRRGEGADLGNLGNAYADLGEPRKAIDFHEQALVIAREIGDRRGEGNGLWNSAVSLRQLGEHVEAIARADAALAIFEAIEDPNSAKVRAELERWGGGET